MFQPCHDIETSWGQQPVIRRHWHCFPTPSQPWQQQYLGPATHCYSRPLPSSANMMWAAARGNVAIVQFLVTCSCVWRQLLIWRQWACQGHSLLCVPSCPVYLRSVWVLCSIITTTFNVTLKNVKLSKKKSLIQELGLHEQPDNLKAIDYVLCN